MNDRQRFVRLGLFVIVSVSILVTAVTVLGWRAWLRPTFTFETYFNQSIAGLELGAPASFRGVPLGQVTEILTSVSVYERDTPIGERRDYIVVRVKANLPAEEAAQLREDIGTLVRRGLRAQTRLAGVTGQQYLELDFQPPNTNPPLPFSWTPEYTYVPSAPSVTGEIIARAQSFLASLDEAHVTQLARNIDTLVRNLDAKIGEVHAAELSASAQKVLARVDSVAARLDTILGDPSLTQTLDNAASVSARLRSLAEGGELDSTIAALNATAERMDVLLGDNQYDVRLIVQDLRVTADNLRALSETIRRDPAGVLLGGPPRKIQLPASAP